MVLAVVQEYIEFVRASAQIAPSAYCSYVPMRVLKNVTKRDLDEIKALNSPPKAVADVLAQIILVLTPDALKKDRSWRAVQGVMANTAEFGKSLQLGLRNFDPTTLSAKQRKALAAQTFESVREVGHKSKAAATFAEIIVCLREVVAQVEPAAASQEAATLKSQAPAQAQAQAQAQSESPAALVADDDDARSVMTTESISVLRLVKKGDITEIKSLPNPP